MREKWNILLIIVIASISIVHSQDKINTHQLSNTDISQLLMIGYKSDAQIRKILPGGIIIFGWSIKGGAEQTKKLIARINNIYIERNLPLPLISIDQEGGKVMRLRKGVTRIPDGTVMGANENRSLIHNMGSIVGQELNDVGFSLNFAPVLDRTHEKSFLENRTWSDDSDQIYKRTKAFAQGLSGGGVIAVQKHFPGHSLGSVDSHNGLPVDNRSEEYFNILNNDPFIQSINSGIDALMTAHILMPNIDSEPVTYSKKILTGILRNKLNYRGVIITDDIEMGGANKLLKDKSKVAIKSLQAGTDMVMVVWSSNIQNRFISEVRKAVKENIITKEDLLAKISRIRILREKVMLRKKLAENRSDFSYDQKQLITKGIWDNGVKFGTNSEKKVRIFNEPLNVLVSRSSTARIWKKYRPNDKIYFFKAKDKTTANLNNFKILSKQDKPLLVITPPRYSMNDRVFNYLKESIKNNQNAVWIHQSSKADLGLEFEYSDVISISSGSVFAVAALMRVISRKKYIFANNIR